jgi:catechol 2,3-dioxygenase-like lactoylglutathione lyase family enzyme
MIIPNLMVSDMVRSLAFYRDKIGLRVVMAIDGNREVLADTDGSNAVFVILSGLDDGELMLQSTASLRAEHPSLPTTPGFTGTIYIRGLDPRMIAAKVDPADVAKPLERQWYGMLELYLRDPDGYLICIGMADGPPVV